jgi:hypothetical protein
LGGLLDSVQVPRNVDFRDVAVGVVAIRAEFAFVGSTVRIAVFENEFLYQVEAGFAFAFAAGVCIPCGSSARVNRTSIRRRAFITTGAQTKNQNQRKQPNHTTSNYARFQFYFGRHTKYNLKLP